MLADVGGSTSVVCEVVIEKSGKPLFVVVPLNDHVVPVNVVVVVTVVVFAVVFFVVVFLVFFVVVKGPGGPTNTEPLNLTVVFVVFPVYCVVVGGAVVVRVTIIGSL